MHTDTKLPPLSFCVLLFGGIGFCVFGCIGCATTPGKSTGIVATPVAPAGKVSGEAEQVEKAPEKLASKKEKPEPKEEKPEDATTLASEAKSRVQWSSSESSLKEAFELSGKAADLAPDDSAIALQHAEHAARYAQVASGFDRQAQIAKEALASLNTAGISGSNLDAKSAYYRGSLTGFVMQAQGLAAAGKIPELEKLFKQAVSSPSLDRGGPLRALGMLYLKAPPWPTGIGDIDLAFENLERAAASYADFPYNHICLARAYAEDGQADKARQALGKAEALLGSENFGALESAWRKEIAEIRGKMT